jgi:hypothetical protein
MHWPWTHENIVLDSRDTADESKNFFDQKKAQNRKSLKKKKNFTNDRSSSQTS